MSEEKQSTLQYKLFHKKEEGPAINFRYKVLLASNRQGSGCDITGFFKNRNGTAFTQLYNVLSPTDCRLLFSSNIFQYFVQALNVSHTNKRVHQLASAQTLKQFELDKRLLLDVFLHKLQGANHAEKVFGLSWDEACVGINTKAKKFYRASKPSVEAENGYDQFLDTLSTTGNLNNKIKFAILWFQIHSLALTEPINKSYPAIMAFYDDIYSQNVYHFFEQFPWLLPKNCVLKCYSYQDANTFDRPKLVGDPMMGCGNQLPNTGMGIEKIYTMLTEFNEYITNQHLYETEIAKQRTDYLTDIADIKAATVILSFDYDGCVAGNRVKTYLKDIPEHCAEIEKIAKQVFEKAHDKLIMGLNYTSYAVDLHSLVRFNAAQKTTQLASTLNTSKDEPAVTESSLSSSQLSLSKSY